MRRIIGYLEANKNFAECSRKYGFSRTTIEKLYKRFLSIGQVADIPRPGRPQDADEKETKQILNALKRPYKSTREVGLEFGKSHSTIEEIAHKGNLYYRHFIKIPKLTELYKKLRKNFCEMNMTR